MQQIYDGTSWREEDGNEDGEPEDSQGVIRKSVKKVVKKHGPKLVASLAGGIPSTLATLASTAAELAH
jgi:hypothetical protein